MPGEYLCGYATHDHLDLVDFWFTHSSDSITLKIYSTVEGMAWGIKEVVVHALACDATCSSCTGPTVNYCTACSDPNRIPIAGFCQCDSSNNYYLQGGSCTTNCGAEIKDALAYSCVASCSFPNQFIYTDGSSIRSCVVNCPAPQYKKVVSSSDMTCVSSCFDAGVTDITLNYFKFDGLELVCYNHCPDGTYGDPVSESCVSQCPTTTGEDGYFSSGYFCYESCPTGWAYVPQRSCLASCPSGYFKNYLVKTGTNGSIC